MTALGGKPVGGKTDPRVVATRTALLRVAGDAIREFGLSAAPVDDIARRASVSVGSVYTHFNDKQGIVLAAVDQSLQVLGARLQEALASTQSGLDRVLVQGETQVGHLLRDRGVREFLARPDLWQREPGTSADVDPGRRIEALQQILRASVAQACEHGELRTDSIDHVAHVFWWLWCGVAQTHDAAPQDDAWEALRRGHGVLVTGFGVDAARLRDPRPPCPEASTGARRAHTRRD